jgi:ligand-binding sensor domain-containing protein/signal transduction histidine kinase/AraC-like DNA-binding protein
MSFLNIGLIFRRYISGTVSWLFIPGLLALTLSPLCSWGQSLNLNFFHISYQEGLSNSTVEAIAQDSFGFIWIGTRDGLNRYDGYQVVVFRNDPADKSSISDNFIRTIYEDSNKDLWIGTMNGLNKFERTASTFKRFKSDKRRAGSISNNIITSIYEDSNRQFWVGTYGGGLNLLNKRSGKFNSFIHNPENPGSLRSNNVNALVEDRMGRLWVATDSGLHALHRQSKTFKVISNLSDKRNLLKRNTVKSLAIDHTGYLWLGTEDKGLSRYHPATGTFKNYNHNEWAKSSLSNDQIRTLLVDSRNRLWVGSINGGLDLYLANLDAFQNFQHDPEHPRSLSQRTVSALFEDKQHNLWIGTHRGGINLYSPLSEKFNIFRKERKQPTLSYNDVRAFFEDSNGLIWIATDGGGLNSFNRKSGAFNHYRHDPFKPLSIGSDAVLDIRGDKNGALWIGTWGGGLNVMDKASGTFRKFTHVEGDPNSISSNYVQKTLEDSHGNFWVATYYGGLNLFDRKTRRFRRIKHDPDKKSGVFGENIVSLHEDINGDIWMGTDDGGLNRYQISTKRFLHYFRDEERMPDLRVLFTDRKGRLWVGHRGLYLFDRKQNRFALFRNKAGLSTDFIKSILEDRRGNLWISTSNGLTKINPETGAFKKYSVSDGLQGQEFEANAALLSSKGEMYFGGINGFNTFFPEEINTNAYLPNVSLVDFMIYNKKIVPGEKNSPLKEDISLTKEIRLSYKQSTFSLSFAALDFTGLKNNQYAYKLEGLDKDWNYVGHERKASYTNLSPGTYTFFVKASNSDDVWNNKSSTVRIIIAPPFWLTWWFILLVLVLIIYIIYAILSFKRKLELERMEEKKREEIHQVQLQFFTNISHEFRTPLTLIMGPLEQLMKDNQQSSLTRYFQTMHRNTRRLMNLINELMDFRKVETGTLGLRVTEGNIGNFIAEIFEEFKGLAEDKNITFEVINNLPEEKAWFDRQILEKILLNLVHNSFKYTPDNGVITLETLESLSGFKPRFKNELAIRNSFRSGRYIYIRIADNGIGISADSIGRLFERYYRITEAHLGSGIGLAFVKSLTHLHKGDIYVYSERHQGTEIIVAVPIERTSYSPEEIWTESASEGGTRLESVNPEPLLQDTPAGMTGTISTLSDPPEERILIVDDNPELRAFLQQTLSATYQVAVAENGMIGLLKAKDEFPDLILSDVLMPEMNGIQFCKAVKEDLEIGHIPFLMLTARNALEARIEGAESGADFYLPKPISIDLLLLTIRNIFEQKRKLKERYLKDYQSDARELVHSAKEKEFIDRLSRIIHSELKNPDLDVDFVCTAMGMSKTKLYQKIKTITGESIGEFIRSIRLKRAAQIMTHEDVLITEVMYRVGIQTQSYFSKAFKKQFGKTPSQFLSELERHPQRD